MKKMIFLTVLAAFLLSPFAAWAFYKPVRIILPEWAGVTCVSKTLCIDDVSKVAEAQRLYDKALLAVETNVGTIRKAPRGVFCATDACADYFGQPWAAAYNVGTVGFVVQTRGWKPHYVEHEMIHHLQNERLGSLTAWFFKPTWWREGMAYSLSRDPRRPIPVETLEDYRTRFEDWYADVGRERLWEAARGL